MNDIGIKRLETNRLILRKFVSNDSESLYKNCGSDPKVPVFLSWHTHKDSFETYEGILRDVQFKNNRFCTLAVYSILKREWDRK